jgi:hypothetical protein
MVLAMSSAAPSSEPPRVFPNTRWSVVLAARQPTPEPAAALETICRDYWLPIYAYVRRCGKSPHDAHDLTQEFFCRLLKKRWLDAADREKGRLRAAPRRMGARAEARCAARVRQGNPRHGLAPARSEPLPSANQTERHTAMRTNRTWVGLAVLCSLIVGTCLAVELDAAKAELMGRVEHFLLKNFKDVTARKSLAWGEVQTAANGDRSIRYEYEARIWHKDVLLMNQVFTFDPAGKFLRYTNIAGFPKPKAAKPADTSTQAGMKALVEEFFQHNFRDVKRREPLEWGEPETTADGHRAIRYQYRARIWDKTTVTNDQVFTFEPGGKFVSVKDARSK